MGVETSNKKTESLDQSNMGIAIGKKKGKNHEPIMLVLTASKIGLNFLAFFPIGKFRGVN